jgi:hypothetical protein
MDVRALDMATNTTVVLYLQEPKEKVWGLLLSVSTAGIVLRGLDLTVFDDWMRQETRGDEKMIGLSTVFYPMHRVERMERDETIGTIVGYADRFAKESGRTVLEALGLVPTKDQPQ